MSEAGAKRPTMQLIAGQVLGQASMLAVVPVLTRAYGPSAIGVYQAAMAVATTLQPAATMRVEFMLSALVHSASAHVWFRRAGYVTAGGAAVGVVVSATCWVAGATDAANVTIMIVILLVALAVTVLDNAVLIRARASGRLGVRNATAGVVTAVLQLAAALGGAPVVVLALSLLAGRVIAIGVTRRRSDRLDASDAGDEPRPYTLRRAGFAVTSGMSALATNQLLTITSGPAFGSAATGYVGVAQRIAGTPVGLLGQGLSQALQSHSAPLIRHHRPGLHRQVLRQIVLLTVVSAVISAVLIVLAPLLAVPLLGKGWQTAGTVTAVLAVPIACQLVVAPLMPLLPMLGEERLLFVLQSVRLGLAAIAIAAGVLATGDLLWTCLLFAVAVVVGYVVLVTAVLTVARRFDDHASGGDDAH